MTLSKLCPVCEMLVSDNAFSIKFRGLDLWFCSQQCLDRFNQRPSLYIGDPKHGKAAKQHGTKVQKHRRIRLELPDNDEFKTKLLEGLNSLMGITQTRINQNVLEIEYDLVQVSLEDVEQFILASGVNIEQSWLDKVHDALVHFSEEGQLDNLGHPYKDNGCH
ncbi:MAG: hypothetical protein P1P93_02870 [Gammaproteobacteria bacterium]|nr:hypothetical protein [Gammaproteobacteria bacterium]